MEIELGGGVPGVSVTGTVSADPDGLSGGEERVDDDGVTAKLAGGVVPVMCASRSGGDRVIIRIKFL